MGADMGSTTIGTQSRKDAAIAFLRLAASGKVNEAYGQYIGAGFRHHNPHFQGDVRSLAAGMAENAAKFPHKELEVQHAIEDGNLVAVHSRVRLSPKDSNVAVAHIFRFERDRIVELWDIGQPEPQDSPNENGMF